MLSLLPGRKIFLWALFRNPREDFYRYVTGGGGQTQYIFEKPKNILNLGHFRPQKIYSTQKHTEIRTFVDPKNILIASWYMKIESFKAFSATALKYIGEKLSLTLILSNFFISNPKNIPIMLQIAYPKVLDNVLQTQKMSDPPSLNNRESPPGSGMQNLVRKKCPVSTTMIDLHLSVSERAGAATSV